MFKSTLGALALTLIMLSGYALAQTTAPDACSTLICQVMQGFPEVNAWLIATFTFIGLVLRASADFIAFVSGKIANKTASEWAQKLDKAALWVASIIGWFGGGVPKRVLEQKAEKIVNGK